MPVKSAVEKQVASLEKKIRTAEAKIAGLKRRWGDGVVQDYPLKDHAGRTVKLSQAFGVNDTLILVHNMGRKCPYCTLWADGFNALWQNIENGVPGVGKKAAFVVVSPDDAANQKKFAASRGWTFRMLSSAGTSLFRDMGYADEQNRPWPGVSILRKKGSKISRIARDFFGPGDKYNPIFSFYELIGW